MAPRSGSLASSALQYPQTERRETEKLMSLAMPLNAGNAKGTVPPQHVLSSTGFALGIQGILNSSQNPRVAFPRTGPLAPPAPKPLTKKRSLPIWARVVMGLLVFLIITTGGALAYYETQIAPSLNNIIGKQAIHHPNTQTADGQTNTQNDPGAVPTGRTNILLLGSDTDGKGNDANVGTPLAQTIMIITVDPQTNFVGMVSIPRDMQVTQNGYTAPKLDEVFAHAYAGGNLQDKVASGAGAMEDIIQYNFGIHIDYYAWVGLGGFVKVIDTAGGIDVDTIHPMVDDTYPDDVGNTNGSIYDYKRLAIAPGPQHLNGLQALEYVRTRHSDLIGDFGRTVRQQQMITQLKVKLATPDTTGKASAFLQDLNGAVQTDMSLNDIIGLGNLARGIDGNSVQHLTLGPPDYAAPNINGDRASNYLPVCRNIVPAIQKMFNIRSPNCVSQVGSSTPPPTTPTLPTVTPTPSATPTPGATPTSKPKQGSMPGNTAQIDTMLALASNPLTSGVHSLLDLLFATTFESFDAMQI
jgi:LCP family protein required for cell wall assembly